MILHYNKERFPIPHVTVVIPTYNRAPFIARAVNSVLQQTYGNLELIVVDDGSTDDTGDKIAALQQADSRVHYLRHETNRGAQAARNTGIHAAQGDYVAFLDSDNEWLPNKIERQMALFRNGEGKVKVVYAGFRWEYDDGSPPRDQKPFFRGNVYKDALRGWIADTTTLVIRKDVLYMSGLFDERIRANQEWDLCIRLALHAEFDFVEDPLSIYHLHGGPTISKDLMRSANGYLDVITSHRDEIMRELGSTSLAKHFLTAGQLFLQASDFASAISAFAHAIRLRPLYTKAWILWLLCRLGPKTYSDVFSLRRQVRHWLSGCRDQC